MVSESKPDLWALALDRQHIAPSELADALRDAVRRPSLDFRTRLLIRDGIHALECVWGSGRLIQWLNDSPERPALDEISKAELGPPGFPSLANRIMEPTRTDTVLQFLRELGQVLSGPSSVAVGGSVALILQGLLSRRTEDIDVVDEVPVELRSEQKLLDELAGRYGIRLTHFQSHFLPSGWEARLQLLDRFGHLEVRLVDRYDIMLSKLFSARTKDRDDLRALAPLLDQDELTRRLLATTDALRREEKLRKQAEGNWYIIYGQPLPS